jgi:hypothetical protein
VVLGTGVVGIATAAAVGAVFVLLGLRFFRRASGADDAARAIDQKTAAAKVHAAAARLGGDVTAAQIAEQLGVPVGEADKALTAMADGTSVTVEVDTDTGAVHYLFADVIAARPKVRVAAGEPESEEAAKAELEQRRSRI